MRKATILDRVKTENAVILAFTLFGLFGILNHEMWRDELQAWMLGRDSESILALLRNMKYEAHPALWHVVLHGLSQITHNPIVMQIFHLVVSVGIVFLLVKESPFSLRQRFLLPFGYFFFYEYTVISRNYNIGIFCLVLACVVYSKRGLKYLPLSILLALAANANLYALFVSLTLGLFFALKSIETKQYKQLVNLRGLTSVAIAIAGWVVSFAQIVRAGIPESTKALFSSLVDLFDQSTHSLAMATVAVASPDLIDRIRQAGNALTNIWESYVPIPSAFKYQFWSYNLLTDGRIMPSIAGVSIGNFIAVPLSILLLGITAYFLLNKPIVLTTYLFGNLVILAFNTFVHDTYDARHYGHLFILFLLCFWLAQSNPGTPQDSHREAGRRARRSGHWEAYFLTTLFVVHAIAGIHAMSRDYLFPFSYGKAVAEYIEDSGLQEVEIIGSRDRQASVISGYLDVPIFYPRRNELGTFWTTEEEPVETLEELTQTVEERLNIPGNEELLLVLTRPLEFKSPSVSVTLLAEFSRSIVGEDYYLYLAKRT